MIKDTENVALLDLNNYNEIVNAIKNITELEEYEIHKRLFMEAIYTGWNVKNDSNKFGITPHVFNEKLEEFYKNTYAFIFELIVSHCNEYSKVIDSRVVEAINDFAQDHDQLNILCLGDGIGSDSLRFARMNYNVTYFEFDGFSSNFAKYRFERLALNKKIKIVNTLEKIPKNSYDVVICREVLEHVENPNLVICNIWEYLKCDGVAIVTESFNRVEESFPTHLAANQKYHGKTNLLFVENGFYLVKAYSDNRPVIFRKIPKCDASRFESLKKSWISSARIMLKKLIYYIYTRI